MSTLLLFSYNHLCRKRSSVSTEEHLQQRERQRQYEANYRKEHSQQLALKNFEKRAKYVEFCSHIDHTMIAALLLTAMGQMFLTTAIHFTMASFDIHKIPPKTMNMPCMQSTYTVNGFDSANRALPRVSK